MTADEIKTTIIEWFEEQNHDYFHASGDDCTIDGSYDLGELAKVLAEEMERQKDDTGKERET